MNQNKLFGMALVIQPPWQIVKVEFLDGNSGKELRLSVEHSKVVKFDYKGSEYSVYDQFVNILTRHWCGVKTYFKRLVTNAYAERVNLKIQEIKRVAKGYRNNENYKMMIYFHLGKLELGLPTVKG